MNNEYRCANQRVIPARGGAETVRDAETSACAPPRAGYAQAVRHKIHHGN